MSFLVGCDASELGLDGRLGADVGDGDGAVDARGAGDAGGPDQGPAF